MERLPASLRVGERIRLTAGLLYGVTPADPSVLGSTGALLLVVGLAAALGPAVRASRTDPAVVFRDD